MRYEVGFILVLALGVMGCGETTATPGSGGSAGDGGTAGSAGIGGNGGAAGSAGIGGSGGSAGTGGMNDCQTHEDCDDGNQCTRGLCIDERCRDDTVANETECDLDGLPGLCISRVCTSACEVTTCNDFNDCTTDSSCDPADGTCAEVAPVADGTDCAGGTCVSGVCALASTTMPCTEQGIRNAIAAGGEEPYKFACDGPTTVVTEAEIVIDNDVILDGELKLTLDGNGDHRVLSLTPETTAELRGFTVNGGNAQQYVVGVNWPYHGGGISNNSGTLTLTNTTVSGNTAAKDGGGIYNRGDAATLTITNSSVSGNTAADDGGGIYNSVGTATLIITNSSVSGNTASYGGGIMSHGKAALTNSSVSGNTASDAGAGGIANGGTLALTDSTVSGNTANYGGGIVSWGDLALAHSTVSANTSSDAGGILIFEGTATLSHSTVAGHANVFQGGGILNLDGTVTLTDSTVSGNTDVLQGGGIYNEGTLILTHSAVSKNTATFGGGILNVGGTATLTNSTASGNTANLTAGGLYNRAGTLELSSSTVSNNTASDIGAAIRSNRGILTLTNSLVDGDCSVDSGETSEGGNLESPGDTCGFDQGTDQVNVSADELKLGPLRDNGGPTETHALGVGSVAIDVVPVDACELDEDQRGEPRPGGAMCDVGAFELQP